MEEIKKEDSLTCFKPVKVIREGNIVIEIGEEYPVNEERNKQERKEIHIDLYPYQYNFTMNEMIWKDEIQQKETRKETNKKEKRSLLRIVERF